MASSSQNPQMAHPLWLQRRSARRCIRRTQWRSDWAPFGLVLLLLGLLIILSVILSSEKAVERMKQADQGENNGSTKLPVVGVLAKP